MSDLGERPASRGEWLAVGAAWIGGLVLLAGWLRGTSTGTLREELKVWQFWSLEICVLLAAVIAIASVATARADFWRRDGLPIGGLAVVGLALTLFVAPRTNRIFYDEHIYQGIGQNLADLRLAQVCNDGQVSGGRLRCASGRFTLGAISTQGVIVTWRAGDNGTPKPSTSGNVRKLRCPLTYAVGTSPRSKEIAAFGTPSS